MSTPKRPKRSRDPNKRPYEVVQESVAEGPYPQMVPIEELAEPTAEKPEPAADEERHPHAVALGRLGGAKGGKARAKRLTAENRQAIARKAARGRWNAKKDGWESRTAVRRSF